MTTDQRRWIWIELIGFDNQLPDFGVGAYLANTGFVPDAMSLLLSSPDFIHLHRGADSDTPFSPVYCSYNGHPFNAERQRQGEVARYVGFEFLTRTSP